MVTDISNINTQTNNTQLSSTKDKAALADDFDQFLLLLTTQLQNQDPLSPMDSNEFTNQLVAFSSVEQQIKANEMLEQILSMSSLNSTNIGLGFIGLDVDHVGNNIDFDGSSPIDFSYELSKGAARTDINIIDENGNTVFKAEGDNNFGKNYFTWDGTNNDGQLVPAGKYSIEIGAIDDGGDPITGITTIVPSRVTGIETADDGNVDLILAGGNKIPMSAVRKAQQPAS